MALTDEVRFACGWTLRRVPLDADGRDESGWDWGRHPQPLWWCTDGSDSVTVRADDARGAADQLLAEGMPPRRIGKLNWSSVG